MKRIHALILVLALGIAVVAGSFAALRTTQLGTRATATNVNSAQIAKQNGALTRAEAALRAELRKKPPAIAALPKITPQVAPPAMTAARLPAAVGPTVVVARPAAPPAATQTVIYHRPPPIVHVIHRPGGGEHESEGAPQGVGHAGSGGNGGNDD